jgi:hypothetical protein
VQVRTCAQFKAMLWCACNDWEVHKEHLVSQPKLDVSTSKIRVTSVVTCAILLGRTIIGIN